MKCPKCEEAELEDMGYGDRGCPNCKHVEYSESEGDFNQRMGNDSNITYPLADNWDGSHL